MPVDYSILQPAQIANPFAIAMQVQQLRASQENTRGLTEQRRLLAEQRQSAIDDQASLDQAVTPGATLDSVLSQLPGHMHAAVRKQWSDADAAAQTARDNKAKYEASEADYFGTLAATVKQYNYDPGAAQIVLAHAKAQGHDTSQIETLLQQNPAGLKGVVDGLIAASPKQRELANNERSTQITADRLTAERPGIVARGQVDQQVAAGTVGGVTPAQKLVNDRAVEQARIEREKLAFERQKATDAKGDVTNLTPEGLDAAAMMFAKTGQLPALGMGDKTTRKQIINRAAVMVPGLDVASAKADFEANKKSLDNISGTLDTLESFSKASSKNLDQFVGLASKLPDSGVPWANTPLRYVTDKMAGGEYMPAINAARAVATREIARITSDPKLRGVLSDSARQEVDSLIPADITFNQLKRVVPVLLRDMANVHDSLSEQKTAIQGRIKLGTPQPPQPPPVDTKAPGGPKVGDVVQVAGKNIKISAIHPDGTFDGAEVKR